MFAFFDSIGSLISALLGYISSGFGILILMFGFIADALEFFVSFIDFLPPFLSGSVIAFLSFSVIIHVLNKGG